MKKWLRRSLIAAAVLGLGLGILYEYATHVGRGWLGGEAFYQGRPTSYWRWAIEDWVERFESPDKADAYLRAHSWEILLTGEANLYHAPRPTFWAKACGWVGARADDDWNPPLILGFVYPAPDEDAEPVLRELEREPALQRFIERARRQQRYRKDLHGAGLVVK